MTRSLDLNEVLPVIMYVRKQPISSETLSHKLRISEDRLWGILWDLINRDIIRLNELNQVERNQNHLLWNHIDKSGDINWKQAIAEGFVGWIIGYIMGLCTPSLIQ